MSEPRKAKSMGPAEEVSDSRIRTVLGVGTTPAGARHVAPKAREDGRTPKSQLERTNRRAANLRGSARSKRDSTHPRDAAAPEASDLATVQATLERILESLRTAYRRIARGASFEEGDRTVDLGADLLEREPAEGLGRPSPRTRV